MLQRDVPPVPYCILCDVRLDRNKGDASMLDGLHRLIFIPLGRDLETPPCGAFFLAGWIPEPGSNRHSRRTMERQQADQCQVR